VTFIARGLMSKRALLLLPVVGLLGVAGCKASGGGYIQSATGADAAHFGFTFQQTRHGNVVHGSYHDGYVKFRVDGGGGSGPGSCGSATLNYVSTSPDYPGTGQVEVNVCDNGEGTIDGDTLSVNVISGPYSGYQDSGTVQGGNIQVNQNTARHAARHHHRS
jgi:hypothetical protein